VWEIETESLFELSIKALTNEVFPQPEGAAIMKRLAISH
jgi:hypothetical protein